MLRIHINLLFPCYKIGHAVKAASGLARFCKDGQLLGRWDLPLGSSSLGDFNGRMDRVVLILQRTGCTNIDRHPL